MLKLQEVSRDKKILTVGASGTGKTHLIGTLCKLVPTVVVTADLDGLDTLQTMNANPYGVIAVTDWKRSWDYYKEIKAVEGKCQAVAIDSLGSLQDMAHEKVNMTPRKWEEANYNRNRAEAEARMLREMMLGERRMDQSQWGGMFLAIDTFLTAVLQLNFAIKLVTCLEQTSENPRDKEEHVYPHLQKALKLSLSARFSLVCNSFVADVEGKPRYALTCREHPRIETKSRYGPGRTWLEPDITKLLSYMNRKEGASIETEQEKKVGTGIQNL